MEFTGTQLITQATIFGLAGVVFTSIPFLFVICNGIAKSSQYSTSGQTILGVVIKALIVHLVSSVCFIGCIKVLDTLQFNSSGYFSQKLFNIFWNGDNQSKVFSLVGSSASNESLGAYTILHLSSVVVQFVYAMLPIVLFVLALCYGVFLAQKDTYKENYVGVAMWSIASIIISTTLFIAWSYIASPALFFPSGNLLSKIQDFYKVQLGV